VILDTATGVLAGAKSNSILLDFTTSEPTLAQEIYEKAKEKGVASLDTPVSGGFIIFLLFLYLILIR
jgi:3-hydroxyisobutyrate dehydrogenase